MFGWNIVNFTEDNTVSVVPDIWLKKNICAWPKDQKNSQKIIESRVKPNKNDFYFYNIRKMSGKTYTSLDKAKSKLPKAMIKSDLSSTEDENFNGVPKYDLKRSASPKNKLSKKVKLHSEFQHESSSSCPPQYNPVKDTIDENVFYSQSIINQISTVSDNDSSILSDFDDSDKDQTWIAKPKKNSEKEFDSISPLKVTPTKSIPSPVFVMTSPSGPWRVNTEVDIEKNHTNNSGESKTANKFNNLKNSTVKNNCVKRQLQYPVENQSMISDFYNISLTSFSFLKYEVQALKILCHSINENIEKIMNNSSGTTFVGDDLDIETLFPIKNDEDLLVLHNKVQDKDLRKLLVSKISLFVGKKDIRNSVRRIMGRMFDDSFLVNYSLYGFKQKKSFSNLACYRLIIDALRLHLKYKTHTDKEIDDPLGIWLSHAPYRLAAQKKI